ncbi:TssG superfamily type VI secretion protein (plasmid) [Candidatus Trichorickettsia mobilis]|uniref:type VI secretion system baseplate subunit TssG n=1 Tax=Candidatus Trichorickettsia mobilis TaxID=1346319 RepID=UPI002B25DB0C|nr:type VI secretion system baseplate subunit TssG [Candidatus Trichorickettsia mobilis]WPY01671.1 TssG superfamily type VI secretion protein [Candidatus Trichorickettsia mobilis]
MRDIINHQLSKKKFVNFNAPQFIKLINYLEYKTQSPVKFNFVSAIDFSFPAAEIRTIKLTHNNNIEVKAIANFLGIIGPTGILPAHYTEMIIEGGKVKDRELLDFIDIFYDKIIKLFLNIIKKYDIHLGYESYVLGGKSNSIHSWLPLTNLIGVSKKIADKAIPGFLLNYLGLLLNSSRSGYNLKIILSNYLALPVEIQQFISESITLDKRECSKLAKINNQLGVTLYLGQKAYFYQNRIKIIIGPMNLSIYSQLVIESEVRNTLNQILDFYLGAEIKYQLFFLLLDKDKPTQLSSNKVKLLGKNIWLKKIS